MDPLPSIWKKEGKAPAQLGPQNVISLTGLMDQHMLNLVGSTVFEFSSQCISEKHNFQTTVSEKNSRQWKIPIIVMFIVIQITNFKS
jgi:hypothetical protein